MNNPMVTNMSDKEVLGWLKSAAAVAGFCEPHKRLAANGPTGRQAAERALALPRVDGDETYRALLEEYIR